MGKPRHEADQFLRAIQNDLSVGKRGKLKIFFGYASGVGKTYAMLLAAHQAKERGTDVIAGYIESHGCPQTTALLDGLELLPGMQEMALREFDIDAALKRKPQLVLVDELAHSNAEGRHAKRYQDVQELLNAGIDVYATVNVQHIESLNDTVASITGVLEQERIPDSVFDQADQVELVDIEPAELLERLAGGHVYPQRQNSGRFFTVENLTALRELALRRCAERVNLLNESARLQGQGDYHTDEHILVCLSSSPSNGKIIRTAARMARAFRGSFTALFVETPDFSAMGEADRNRLRENIHLAQQLGAAVETTYGDDVPYQIAEFARLSGVSKIVIGRSTVTRRSFFSKPALTERLIADAPNLDIHVIPDASVGNTYPERRNRAHPRDVIPLRDIVKSVLVLLAATLIGYVFYALGFSESNIVSLYIFGVLVISVITTNRFCAAAASIVSVLIFNFFFTVPRLTFHFYDPNYWMTFLIMFMVALLTGSLATRLKDNAKQSAHAAFRTKILFETNQLLQKETDEQSVMNATAGQLLKLLKRDFVIYLSDGHSLTAPSIFRVTDSDRSDLTSESEKEVAQWVLRNNKHAGATTDTLSNAKCLYLAIRVNQQVYGVVGIAMKDVPLDSFENSVLLSILGECALALENIKNAREKEAAAILAKNEQLRANLLRTISHDLRTPLTSISGNAGNLLANHRKMDEQTQMRAFSDIYDDSIWLIDLVENLLAVTRIEDGKMHLTQSVELMDEVITEALRHCSRKGQEHTIRVSSSDELILARIDAKLIVQVLINLVNNAIKYTPAGSVIEIHTEKKGKQVMVSVSDNGPGIPDRQKSQVFEMFYTGANKIADSRRSLGLGLSLCKSIVTAHGGTIYVTDNHPKGAVFTFTLPAGEVELHE
ncbi:MAG: sensor histidine kinase KdpD [Candidatus Faecousia sp.]|nr:sensor histidine kinase KdpD [Candidatus Faecousia sp.]